MTMMNETEKKARIAALENLLEKVKEHKGKDLSKRMGKDKETVGEGADDGVDTEAEGETPSTVEDSAEECAECKGKGCAECGKEPEYKEYKPSDEDAAALKKLVAGLF